MLHLGLAPNLASRQIRCSVLRSACADACSYVVLALTRARTSFVRWRVLIRATRHTANVHTYLDSTIILSSHFFLKTTTTTTLKLGLRGLHGAFAMTLQIVKRHCSSQSTLTCCQKNGTNCKRLPINYVRTYVLTYLRNLDTKKVFLNTRKKYYLFWC